MTEYLSEDDERGIDVPAFHRADGAKQERVRIQALLKQMLRYSTDVGYDESTPETDFNKGWDAGWDDAIRAASKKVKGVSGSTGTRATTRKESGTMNNIHVLARNEIKGRGTVLIVDDPEHSLKRGLVVRDQYNNVHVIHSVECSTAETKVGLIVRPVPPDVLAKIKSYAEFMGSTPREFHESEEPANPGPYEILQGLQAKVDQLLVAISALTENTQVKAKPPAVHCYYHSTDLDGIGSAAVVLRKHPGAVLYPMDYGDPLPKVEGAAGAIAYMVDFSLQPFEQMEVWAAQYKEVHWIDHHETAMQAYENWRNPDSDPGRRQFKGLRRMGIGACQLTWEYLFPDTPVPKPIRLLAEFDVWNHTDTECLPFQYGVKLEDTAPNSHLWEDIIDGNDGRFSYILDRGRTALVFATSDNAVRAKALCFRTSLDVPGESTKLRILAANIGPAGSVGSQFFESVWDPKEYEAMCIFYWNPDHNRWRASIYTTREDIHCGKIAKKLGGGGHPQAAGFECDHLPFLLR